MAAYSLTFGFRKPYQVLGADGLSTFAFGVANTICSADSLMCKEAVEHKLDLVKQLGIVLQGTVKPSM